jgi:hypothetical protein
MRRGFVAKRDLAIIRASGSTMRVLLTCSRLVSTGWLIAEIPSAFDIRVCPQRRVAGYAQEAKHATYKDGERRLSRADEERANGAPFAAAYRAAPAGVGC